MKLQLFLVSVLQCLVLTNQEERGFQLDAVTFDEGLFQSIWNATYPMTDEVVSPSCFVNVPGFNSLGLMITYIIVFVFSIVGNSVVVYVVCYMKKGRGSTDIYLMHLAIADLLFCLTLPFWAVYTHFGWIFGNALCKILSGFQEASVYSGVFLLACISVDRYFAIVRATRVQSSHHLLVNVVCTVVWIVAAVLSLPLVLQRESMYAEVQNGTICYDNLTGESMDRWRVTIRVLRHTVGFFLPLIVMAMCYGWTVIKLYHTRNQQKYKAMRVILAVVLVFVLCWLPFNITILIDTLMQSRFEDCESLYILKVMLNVTEVLAFMHCAVNPILYAFIGQKFRNQLLSALYKHGLISKRLQVAYRKGSVYSVGSSRSRNTSVTM